MDLKEALLFENSKAQIQKITSFIGTDKKRFEDLMALFFGGDYRLNQRAAAIMNACYIAHPKLLSPYIAPLIDNLSKEELHDAVKRNTVRILQFMDIPDDLKGEAYDICYKYLISSEEAIAIKAFSMRVLANICKSYPELKNEVIPAIEDLLPYGSAGIKNRGAKILKELNS